MLLLLAALAQSPPPPSLSGDAAARIESVFVDIDRTSSPGCAAGVVMDGALVFADGYGSANLDHQIPITPGTVFYLGSVSKQFTAGAAALAARQGRLSLDDDIRKWVPELPAYERPITIRHLIHHTSGLRDYLTLQSLAGTPGEYTDEEIIALLARQRALNFPPGERYLYSNSGYFLLSEIVERATGLTLRAFADRHFFRPFGMLDSHFHDDADHVVPSRATGYRPVRASDGADETDGAGDAFRMEHRWDFAQVGSGGVYSSVRDVARWEAAFHSGAVGPAGFTESLLERGVLASGDTLPYAFGVTLGEHRGLRTIAHGGSLAGFRSHVVRFPDHATSVVVLCNVTNADPGDRAMRVAEIVLGELMAPPAERTASGDAAGVPQEAEAPRPLTPPQLAELAGRYRSDELGVTSEIRVVDGGLARDGRVRLRHVGPDELAGGGAVLRFQRDRRGRITGYVLDAGRASGIIFERAGS